MFRCLPFVVVALLAASCLSPRKATPNSDLKNADVPTPLDGPGTSDTALLDIPTGDTGDTLTLDTGDTGDARVGDLEVGPCEPLCDGLECGPDGCGGSCGTCGEGTKCLYGKCVIPSNQCLDPRADDPNDGCENGYVTDYQVNASNVGDQVEPVIVSTDEEEGAFAIAWSDCPLSADSDGDGVRDYLSCNVAFRGFDVKGVPTSSKDRVGTAASAGSEYRPGIAPLNGGFMLGWIVQTGQGRRVRARMWALDPVVSGGYKPYPEWEDIAVGETSEVDAESPVALASSDSGLDSVVVWAGEIAKGELGIVGHRIVSPEFGVFQTPEGIFPIAKDLADQRLPVVVRLNGDTYAVLWEAALEEKQEPAGEGSDCLGIIRRLDGKPVTEFNSVWSGMFQLANDVSGSQTMPTGVAVDWGNVLITTFLGTEDTGILVRSFDLLGAGAIPEVPVYVNPQYEMSMPRIAALHGSRLVVVWKIENTPEDQAGGIYMRLLKADLTTLPGPIHVNGYHFDWQSAPQVAHVGGGEFIVVWESCMGQDGDGCGIFARRFDANGKLLPLVKP